MYWKKYTVLSLLKTFIKLSYNRFALSQRYMEERVNNQHFKKSFLCLFPRPCQSRPALQIKQSGVSWNLKRHPFTSDVAQTWLPTFSPFSILFSTGPF